MYPPNISNINSLIYLFLFIIKKNITQLVVKIKFFLNFITKFFILIKFILFIIKSTPPLSSAYQKEMLKYLNIPNKIYSK